MRLAVTIVLIVCAVAFVPATPRNVAVYWFDRTHATLDWQQVSDATDVCIEKVAANGDYSLIGCFASVSGIHSLRLPPYQNNDTNFFPHEFDRYYINEWRFDPPKQLGRFGPYTLGKHPLLVYIPLLRR